MPRLDQRRQSTLVSLSQISELAGVRPSAVSNWRRRFEDFPTPASSSAVGKDLFALPEVERWLDAHGRRDPGRRNERLLFEASDLLRSDAGSDRIVEILCAATSLSYWAASDPGAHKHAAADAPGPGESRPVTALVESVDARDPSLKDVFSALLDLAPDRAARLLDLLRGLDQDELRDMFEWILTRRSRFTETRTSEHLTDLLMGLGGTGPVKILDPALGEGGFLLAASRAGKDGPRLFGQELNDATWRVAKQRLLVHEVLATIAPGDSLADDAFAELRADIVYCDPPYGAVANWRDGAIADRRWLFGFPAGKTADYAWLQHVIYHLTDNGRGYVLLPAGSLFRRGREADLRRELIRRGAIEAIVSLPAGTAQHTAVPLALWIVRRPDAVNGPAPVLFVDAASVASQKRGGLDRNVTAKVVETVNQWRKRGEVEHGDHRIALSVPVLEILGTDANLLPSRWVHEAQPLDAGRRREELAEAAASFKQARAALSDTDLEVGEIQGSKAQAMAWVRVGDLARDDLVEVIRGVRVPPEDCLPVGVRALRTRDIRAGLDEAEEPCYVDPTSMSPQPVLTQQGDIIVSPGSGKPNGLVDPTGGHVLVYPLQGLRISGDWIDREVAAAFIASPRNRRFVAGTTYGYARLDLRDLELPMLPHEDARQLRAALERLAANEQLARQLAENARTMREALLDLASSGGDDVASTNEGI